MRSFYLVLAAAASLGLTACADYTNTPNTAKVSMEDDADSDPLEPMNRAFFRGNKFLDTIILRPVSYVYKEVVPQGGQTAVSNFLDNLKSPVYFANSLLQGDVENSLATFWRFAVNSTWGIGGLFDVSKDAGLVARKADFGQTLATYGVPSGAYLVLPILGPGTLRDTSGRGVDLVFSPTTWADSNAYPIAESAANGVNFRSKNFKLLDELYNNSVDPYTTFKSAYLQRRSKEVGEAFKPVAKPTPKQ